MLNHTNGKWSDPIQNRYPGHVTLIMMPDVAVAEERMM